MTSIVAVLASVQPRTKARLPEEAQGLVPAPVGRRRVERVVAYPVDDLSLVAVLEVPTADALHQRGGGEAASVTSAPAPASALAVSTPCYHNTESR